MSLTAIPSVVPMITLASQDLGLGGFEQIIILIVVLILFGAPFFQNLVRNKTEGVRKGLFFILAIITSAIILSALSLDVFSGEQKFALTVVLLGWIGAGYWSFGRPLRKGEDR
jgi:hypothetical protein